MVSQKVRSDTRRSAFGFRPSSPFEHGFQFWRIPPARRHESHVEHVFSFCHMRDHTPSGVVAGWFSRHPATVGKGMGPPCPHSGMRIRRKTKRSIIMIAVICLFAGFAAGFFTASLCMAARRGDRMRPDGR